MARPGERLATCQNGHDDWRTRPNGDRYCNTCHTDRNKKRRRHKRGAVVRPSMIDYGRVGDRGPRAETFTYTEIMEARGYVG